MVRAWVTGAVATTVNPSLGVGDWLLGWWASTQDYALVGAAGWLPTSGGVPSAAQQGGWTLYTLTRDGSAGGGGGGSLFKNGALLDAGSTAGPAGLTLGGRPTSYNINCYSNRYYSQFSDSDVAEVIVYDRALSDLERRGVEAWLASRYALSGETSTTPTPSPSPSAMPSALLPPSMNLVTSPPLLWLRPEELPPPNSPLASWFNGAAAARVAAANASGNATLAAALASSASALNAVGPFDALPSVIHDAVSVLRYIIWLTAPGYV